MLRHKSCRQTTVALSIFAALVVGWANVARADDSSMSGVGGSLRIMHSNKTVQMASEVVKITGLPAGKVDATFWLKNTGGPTDVTIGFPGYGYNDSPLLTNFRSQVDGAPVKGNVVTPPADGRKEVTVRAILS